MSGRKRDAVKLPGAAAAVDQGIAMLATHTANEPPVRKRRREIVEGEAAEDMALGIGSLVANGALQRAIRPSEPENALVTTRSVTVRPGHDNERVRSCRRLHRSGCMLIVNGQIIR
jgi:hypothetical protein